MTWHIQVGWKKNNNKKPIQTRLIVETHMFLSYRIRNMCVVSVFVSIENAFITFDSDVSHPHSAKLQILFPYHQHASRTFLPCCHSGHIFPCTGAIVCCYRFLLLFFHLHFIFFFKWYCGTWDNIHVNVFVA